MQSTTAGAIKAQHLSEQIVEPTPLKEAEQCKPEERQLVTTTQDAVDKANYYIRYKRTVGTVVANSQADGAERVLKTLRLWKDKS